MHIQVGVAVGCVFAADFLSELAFGKMLSRERPHISFGFLSARRRQGKHAHRHHGLLHSSAGDGADDLFPTWFNILLPIIYGSRLRLNPWLASLKLSPYRSRAIHMDGEEDNKMSQSSNFSMPSVFWHSSKSHSASQRYSRKCNKDI